MLKKMKKRVDRSSYLFDNKALLALIIPLVIEQLLAVLVGMADSIMIASVGEAAVSGVSLVDQIMVLLINVFAALATGGAVVAGQYLGQKNQKEACKSATQLIWFITLCSVVITLLVYAGKYFILHGIFGKIEADVMGHANTYLMIVTASIPFMALYNGGAAIFRAMGNSKVSMQVSIIMNIINVGGNAILIWPISFTLPATFRASGDAKACMYISILSMWIFRIAFSYVLGKYMGLGVFGVWVAMVIDWVFRALCFVIRYFKGTWRKSAIV